MSQNIFPDIDPTTTSGTQLAALLNDFKDATVSGFTGQNRPANLQSGGYWVKNLDGVGAPQNVWNVNYYDGAKDITVFSIDTVNSTILTGDIANDVTVKRISVDNIGPLVNLVKSRGAGVPVSASDVLGQIDFYGEDAANVQYVQARIVSVSTNEVTSIAQGSYMAFEVTKTDTAALIEVARFNNNGMLAIGKTVASKKLEVYAIDESAAIKVERKQNIVGGSQVIIKKSRVATNGQVINLDEIGDVLFVSTDENGDEIEVAKLNVKAIEDHTTTAQGTEVSISHKRIGQSTYTEALKLSEGVATLYGVNPLAAGSDIDVPTQDLLDDSAVRNLLSIDGQVYGAFEAVFNFFGRDNSNTDLRKQRITIEGIFDHNNSLWHYTVENKELLGSSRLIILDDSNTVGKDLVIDYVNQIASVNFLNGKIYGKLRRSLA